MLTSAMSRHDFVGDKKRIMSNFSLGTGYDNFNLLRLVNSIETDALLWQDIIL